VPEGDTIFRTAQTLNRALAGDVVVRFESVYPSVTRVADDHPVVGCTIESVQSRGKHLLIAFSGGLTLHTHMRMNGSWHIYRSGERWQRPARDMRVLVGSAKYLAVGFNVPVAELLPADALARHRELRTLGPDLLDSSFDRVDAIARLRALGDDTIADALLNQRALAGLGNVLKNETLYVAGVDPFRAIRSLSVDELCRVVDVALDLIRMNVRGRGESLSVAVGRRTTRSLDPEAKLWVYGRGRRPCRRCGTTIRSRKTGLDARLTYWCPQCQR
jgi:endonuclease-8